MKELRIKKGRPLLNYIILTADRYTTEELADIYGGIVPAGMADQLKPYQKVVAISKRIKEPIFKVDDLVLINIDRYGRSNHKQNSLKEGMDEYYDKEIVYSVPVIEIDGEECLKLGDNDIEYIIDEYDIVTIKKKTFLTDGNKQLLTPTKSKIIQ